MIFSFSFIAFGEQWLVALEIEDKDVSELNWSQMKAMSPKKILHHFAGKKVLLLKRCIHGQLYICEGFRNMVHFTLGSCGKKELTKFLDLAKIHYSELRGYSKIDGTLPSWIYALSMPNPGKEIPTPVQIKLHKKVEEAAAAFLPHLLKVSSSYILVNNIIITISYIYHCPHFAIKLPSSKSERFKRCINLGLTDQKCDQYKIINLLRNIKPGLIQTTTLDKEIGTPDLRLLAELSLLLHREILPSTDSFKDSLPLRSGPYSELLSEFARQLGLEDENDIEAFRTAGMAVSIACSLLGHKDLLNPGGKDDVTIQMNVSLEVKSLSPELQVLVRQVLGDNVRVIPVSFIFYPRRCVINFEKKICAINKYPSIQPKAFDGRTKMIDF